MGYSLVAACTLVESQVTAFFQDCEGDWRSERRYYTLKNGAVQEVVSHISIRFLAADSPELRHLAKLHEFDAAKTFVCGTEVTWESSYVNTNQKPVSGSTVFGVRGTLLYRDRGFATAKPVTADYGLRDDRTLVLKTAYDGSSFEEEVRLIGDRTRTRQTIICRTRKEIMIGQYLEQRC
ncbi:MAG: phycobiliprotein lyase [Cyanobacteria bacterium J06559_3]